MPYPAATSSGLPSLYRRPLSLFRRFADRSMRRVHEGSGPVYREEIGAWLLLGKVDGIVCLRIARDEAGKDLVLTAADHERALRLEAERQRAEVERRVRELEEKLRGQGDKS